MSGDVEQLVRQAAAMPTREVDAGEIVARARRQTVWLRAGAGVAGVVVVVAVGLLALPVGGPGPGVEVADEPDAGDGIEDPAPADELEGRTFVSTEVIEDGSPRELIDDTVLTVTFDTSSPLQGLEGENPDEGVEYDSWLRWDAGCNQHRSAAVLDSGTVELVGRRMVTTSLCPDDKEEQDQWLRDFFDAGPTWQLDGSELTLTDEDVVVVLEATGLAAEDSGTVDAAAAEELLGRSFHSVNVTVDGEPHKELSGSVEVDFEDRGDEHIVRFEANCNVFGGVFTITPERLVPDQEAASGGGVDQRRFEGSDVGCRDEQHNQDRWLNDFFAAGPTWQLDDEELLLTTDESEIRLEEE